MSGLARDLAPEIAAKVAEVTELDPNSNEYILSQLGKLTEETGEALGSYLRANGFARRRGTWDEHREELADVVITAYVIAASEGFDLDAAIEKKLGHVMTRGWKDGDILANHVPVPVELLNVQRGVKGGDD